MLDDWALHDQDPARQGWLLAVTRLADDDPTGWRDRAREPAIWKDRAKFAELLATAPIDDHSVPLLLAVEKHLADFGDDPIPFLKRVQQANPGDFWANLRLGDALREWTRPAEAIRYYQAALAIRPDAAIAYSDLGLALSDSGRHRGGRRAVPYGVAARPDGRPLPSQPRLQFEGPGPILTRPSSIADSPSAPLPTWP